MQAPGKESAWRAIGSVTAICQRLGALGGSALECRRLPVAGALLGAVSDSTGGPKVNEGSAGQGSGGGNCGDSRALALVVGAVLQQGHSVPIPDRWLTRFGLDYRLTPCNLRAVFERLPAVLHLHSPPTAHLRKPRSSHPETPVAQLSGTPPAGWRLAAAFIRTPP